MRIKCNVCGKSVSTEVPDETVIRAWVSCPECIEKDVSIGTYCNCTSNWKAFDKLPKRNKGYVIVTSEKCPECEYNYWTFSNYETEVMWRKLVKKL